MQVVQVVYKRRVNSKNTDLAETAIKALTNRGGFDDWWYNIDTEIQTEILEEMEKAIAKKIAQKAAV